MMDTMNTPATSQSVGSELIGKVVLVTGGSRGIGRAIVEAALRAGASVAFCARSQVLEQEQVLAAPAEGAVRALGLRADVSQPEEVEGLFDAVLGAFGRVDVVVNNAGISRDRLLVSLPASEWDEVIGVNCTGAWLVARRAVREFLASGRGGSIVSIGSLVQNGAPSNAAYAASKGALLGLTRAIAAEYGGQGIHAALVVAGYVETELTRGLPEAVRRSVIESCPLRRKAEESEVASAVLFLASGRARGLNGQALYVSGGLREVNG